MTAFSRQIRAMVPGDIFTDTEVTGLIGGSEHRRYGLVKRALAEGSLLQLRRGVYGFAKFYQHAPLSHFEAAQKIYSPSYVSLESALAHHGWTPEAVYTTTSISLKRSKSFETPIGKFSYTRIPEFSFIGVERVASIPVFLVATPTKAIADYVVVHKVELLPNQLRESLRIEEDHWKKLSYNLLEQISESYRNIRLRAFVRAFRKGL
jgi:predicted transcriptional regulator of viral defense system